MTSARTVSRLSRILALIPYVIARQGAGVKEIQERFGYTEAQLVKDLNTVFVCGLPGYGPGDLMEAYIDHDEVVIDAADYFARAPRLSATEALTLLASGLAVVGSGIRSDALTSAIDKLTAVLLPDAQKAIVVDVAPESETLAELKDAVSRRAPVKIVYRSLSKEEETERTVEPWILLATLGNWYLKGFCRMVSDERVFRVDRIRRVEVLDGEIEVPDDVGAEVGYSPSDDDVQAVIELSPSARWVMDYYPVEIVDDDGEVAVVRFSSPDAEIASRLLLRLGGSARLVDGDQVADRLRSIATAILDRYS